MNVSKFSPALVALLALTAGCNPSKPQAVEAPAPDAAAIRTAIEGQLAKFLPAAEAKDGATLATFFTDDAVWVLPDASTFKGQAEITAGAKAFVGSYESITAGTIGIDKLVVISDTEALTFVTATFALTEKGKKAVNHVNPAATYWRKGADGVWRAVYEVNAMGVAK